LLDDDFDVMRLCPALAALEGEGVTTYVM